VSSAATRWCLFSFASSHKKHCNYEDKVTLPGRNTLLQSSKSWLNYMWMDTWQDSAETLMKLNPSSLHRASARGTYAGRNCLTWRPAQWAVLSHTGATFLRALKPRFWDALWQHSVAYRTTRSCTSSIICRSLSIPLLRHIRSYSEGNWKQTQRDLCNYLFTHSS
jgi:hypothetical protein